MALSSAIPIPEIQFLVLLIIAVIVAIIVKYIKLPYTIALILVGIIVGLTGIEEIELSKELIFFIFLPVLLFEGSIHIDLDRLRENSRIIIILAFFGLVISTFIVGILIMELTGIPLIFSVLFGAMIMPTDPVSVLALFKKMGISKELTTIVEGESLFNDGTGIVIFEVLLALSLGEVEFDLIATLIDLGYVVIGGIGIGLILGYVAYGVLKHIDDHLIEVIITGILAYGTFIVAEQFTVSGVMGVVVAGMFMGNRGTKFAMSPTTRISILTSWEIAAFIVNSVIFILVGIAIPLGNLYDNIPLVFSAIFAVILARTLTVYPLTYVFNLRSKTKVPMSWQHVINWGGLHGSIPIALFLGLSTETPYRNEISVMVFGVVLFSLIAQGLTVEPLIKRLGIITTKPEEREYEKIMAKKISLQRARETIKKLYDRKEIPHGLYQELRDIYEKEAEELKLMASEKLEKEEFLRETQLKIVKRKVLVAQKSSILESLRKGLISDEVASELIHDLDSEIDSLME
jgi:CPA1 family monovalent cation:H+ antiporter